MMFFAFQDTDNASRATCVTECRRLQTGVSYLCPGTRTTCAEDGRPLHRHM